MVETPPENYSFIPPDVQLPGTKWLDNHRPVFTVTIEAVTSVHTLNPYLDHFFNLCEYIESRKIPPRIGESNIEKEMKKALKEIQLSDSEHLVKNLTVTLDKLIELLVTMYKIGGQCLGLGPHIFETICSVSNKLAVSGPSIYPCTTLKQCSLLQALQEETSIDQTGRQSLLSTYVQFQCKIPHPLAGSKSTLVASQSGDELERSVSNSDLQFGSSEHTGGSLDRQRAETHDIAMNYPPQIRLLHEEIALHWVVASGSASELSMSNSWFLFELMVKSMIEHLHITHALNTPRKGRFPHQFTDDLSTLVHLVSTKVVGLHNTDLKQAQSLNASLAFFIFDLLSIMDRGFVFGLIKVYYKVIISKSLTSPDLIHYKLDFLRIVCRFVSPVLKAVLVNNLISLFLATSISLH